MDFDVSKHIYHSTSFSEIIKDTIRFFNGTPVCLLPPPEIFEGAGVYALYYVGKHPYYKPLYEQNRICFAQPIYVGKAVPRGWRQAKSQESSNELHSRLCEHYRSIFATENLDTKDFYCRFMILEKEATDMIGTVEAALIRHYRPIWNNAVDGFGNHTPGKGRFGQAKSDWDVIHPGRTWANRCKGVASTINDVEDIIKNYFENYELH